MNINDNLLQGDKVNFVESPNHSGKFADNLPDTIIIHYTAGSSAESSVRTLTDPNVKASAHVVVGKDGSITQLVPFDTVAWHAGKSSYNGRSGYNQYSIGIEIDNAGLLTKVGDQYQAWFGRKYGADEVVKAVHRNEHVERYWHAYTEEQIAAVEELCRLLINTYNIQAILGHEEVSPGRKVDPGPAFPLDKLRDKLLCADRNAEGPADEPLPETAVVNTDGLNIRLQPQVKAELAAKPLTKGAKVTIHQEQNGWYQVTTEVTGWVYGKYVDPDNQV